MTKLVPLAFLAGCIALVTYGYELGSIGGLALMAIGAVAGIGTVRLLLVSAGPTDVVEFDGDVHIEHVMRRDAAMMGGFAAYDGLGDSASYPGGAGGDTGGGGTGY